MYQLVQMATALNPVIDTAAMPTVNRTWSEKGSNLGKVLPITLSRRRGDFIGLLIELSALNTSHFRVEVWLFLFNGDASGKLGLLSLNPMIIK